MKNIVLSPPTFAFIVGTRVALAAGIGLLVSTKLPDGRRRAIGAALAAFGVMTTIPAAISVFRGLRRSHLRELKSEPGSIVYRDESLIGAVRFPRTGDL